MTPPICPKCHGAMTAGFVLDRSHANALAQATWQDGEPEKSWWYGLKTKGHQQLPITTYRCERCGYLEAYAPPLAPGA